MPPEVIFEHIKNMSDEERARLWELLGEILCMDCGKACTASYCGCRDLPGEDN